MKKYLIFKSLTVFITSIAGIMVIFTNQENPELSTIYCLSISVFMLGILLVVEWNIRKKNPFENRTKLDSFLSFGMMAALFGGIVEFNQIVQISLFSLGILIAIISLIIVVLKNKDFKVWNYYSDVSRFL